MGITGKGGAFMGMKDQKLAKEIAEQRLIMIAPMLDVSMSADDFYEKEQEYLDEQLPELSAFEVALSSAIADSPIRQDIEDRYGKQYFVQIYGCLQQEE